MDIDDKLKTLINLLSIKTENGFKPDDIQSYIDNVWVIINSSGGKISDLIINKLCKIITKLSIILDAYKANMIKFDNFKVYIEREKVINDLAEIDSYLIK